MGRPFADRRDAGRAVAAALREMALLGTVALDDPVVLGLPRGGVVVAAEVAAALGARLDVVLVRKLGLPDQPELAMGAIAAAGDSVETVRTPVAARAGVDGPVFAAVRDRELVELRRREAVYRAGRPPVLLAGRAVVLVDDGLATGATMRAAIAAVRRQQPVSVIVAVPVGSHRVCAELAPSVDRVVCLETPSAFRAVGQTYRDFTATEDAEVVAALDAAHRRTG
jgi:putative phosphoribosyl transferase